MMRQKNDCFATRYLSRNSKEVNQITAFAIIYWYDSTNIYYFSLLKNKYILAPRRPKRRTWQKSKNNFLPKYSK